MEDLRTPRVLDDPAISFRSIAMIVQIEYEGEWLDLTLDISKKDAEEYLEVCKLHFPDGQFRIVDSQ